MTQNYIGVDLSKDWLDIYHPATGHSRVANSDSAVQAWLATISPRDCVVFEATSGCDRPLMRLLTAQDQPARRLNPLFSWHFAQSLNLPKTDRVDAAMLARMGAERQLSARPVYDAARAELAELSGRRDQLKRMETQEKNRLREGASAVESAPQFQAKLLSFRNLSAGIAGYFQLK